MLTTNRVLNGLSDLATVGLSQGEILAKKTVRRQVSMLHILLIVLTLAKWQCCSTVRHNYQAQVTASLPFQQRGSTCQCLKHSWLLWVLVNYKMKFFLH